MRLLTHCGGRKRSRAPMRTDAEAKLGNSSPVVMQPSLKYEGSASILGSTQEQSAEKIELPVLATQPSSMLQPPPDEDRSSETSQGPLLPTALPAHYIG